MDISSTTAPVTVQVSPGQYNESLTINDAGLTLTGNVGVLAAGSDPAAPQISGVTAGGNVITVNANNVTISGLLLNAQVGDGSVADSVNGIYANGVDSLSIAHNTLDGFAASGISTPAATNLALNVNLNIFSPTQATAAAEQSADATQTTADQFNDNAAAADSTRRLMLPRSGAERRLMTLQL